MCETWPSNDPGAPISRERQIELMQTAEERVKASLEYWRTKPMKRPGRPPQRQPRAWPPIPTPWMRDEMNETITTQAVREMAERLASWSSLVSSGYECPAAGAAMYAAHVMLLALVEERDRLEANRILLEALVLELKAEKQPTLSRFATLLRRATTKVNRATLREGRDE